MPIKKSFLVVAVFCVLTTPSISSYAGEPPLQTAAAPSGPRPSDVTSPDAILDAVYDVISGPTGSTRDWARFRALFIPEGRLIVAARTTEGTTARVLDPESFSKLFATAAGERGFFERDIARRTERYGDIAHVFSTYESRYAASDPKPFQRGINSFQLLFDGKRWWIVTIYWQSETAANPIPQKYLESVK